MRFLFVWLVACGPSLASVQHDAETANDRAYNRAFTEWRSKHADARELASHVVENPAQIQQQDGFTVDGETHELAFVDPTCPASCEECDRGTQPSVRVFATGDSFILLRMTPRVHERTVKSDECDPGCGTPVGSYAMPRAYPVTLPAKIEIVDIAYDYEHVSVERERCPGPPRP